MTYQHHQDLHLTYSPERGYWHFMLYIEPPGHTGSAINAAQQLDASASRYAAEWRDRLTLCAPDALHVSLVTPDDAPKLWHPCVYDDPDSPSAIAGDGCVCWQTFRDPITWLPVAVHHYRTVTGKHEHWKYHTYAPLALPDGERLTTLIIDREAHMVWARTDRGTLHILPEKQAAGYGTGYHGSGPTELARMIEKIVASDGYDAAPGTPNELPADTVLKWTSSQAAAHTQELTLHQLALLCRTGVVA
ncbi:hypothetical protein QTQ03_28580 [Micromonospora sp. WMMA1363]|uniref:hypothetical protein n=1 Tax=Micromonospora sp. WMMA1363 TaxID=3053985 RepID=UPI00259C6C3D|nr:hypothetical protein [Micromonospora sp. WMMA1363]MDM4723364.1 hypothetical protein [Micromonospora sp. WMMA1363]